MTRDDPAIAAGSSPAFIVSSESQRVQRAALATACITATATAAAVAAALADHYRER